MIYLASPYSHKNPAIQNYRYGTVLAVTSGLIRNGVTIYSPIVHCHEMARVHEMPTDFNFWQRYNEGMIKAADELWVLQMDGWKESKGVQSEIEFALKLEKPIMYLEHKA